MERSKTSEAVEGRLMGGYLGLGRFEIVRYKAIVEEIFQAWIPKIRISTTTGAAAIEHEGDEYLGALLFEDHNSCLRIYHLLLSHRGEVIRKVSEIDVPHSSTTAPIKPKTCKICGSIDNCDFKVMDDVWRTTIPIE